MGTLITEATVEKLVNIGANVEITSDAKISPTLVEKIIKTAIKKNLHVTIHSGNFDSSALEKFAKIGLFNVTIKI